jgi:Pyruvate/2-oxoacid:ferredoxin oxidoreductase delta subunit
VDLKKVVGFHEINTLLFPLRARSQSPQAPGAEGRGDAFQEATAGLSRERMAQELSRCFQCGICTGCDLCFLLCPDVSIAKAATGGYEVREDYCKGCSVCAASCPRHVIEMGREP